MKPTDVVEYRRATDTGAGDGLELAVLYRSEDDGDRYDEVEPGVTYHVLNAYRKTAAAERLGDALARKHYVEFA